MLFFIVKTKSHGDMCMFHFLTDLFLGNRKIMILRVIIKWNIFQFRKRLRLPAS